MPLNATLSHRFTYKSAVPRDENTPYTAATWWQINRPLIIFSNSPSRTSIRHIGWSNSDRNERAFAVLPAASRPRRPLLGSCWPRPAAVSVRAAGWRPPAARRCPACGVAGRVRPPLESGWTRCRTPAPRWRCPADKSRDAVRRNGRRPRRDVPDAFRPRTWDENEVALTVGSVPKLRQSI